LDSNAFRHEIFLFLCLKASVMKKILLTLGIVFAFTFSKGQEEVRLTFSGVSILNPTFTSYSLNPSIDIGVGEHLNIHYSLGFGVRGNNKFYMHMPGLAPVGMLAFLAGLGNGGEFWRFVGIVLFILPEGISYDIPLNDKWEMSPFININSAETYAYGVNNNFRYKFSADGGIATRYYFNDKIFGQFYTSAKIIESKGWGASAGLGIGLAW